MTLLATYLKDEWRVVALAMALATMWRQQIGERRLAPSPAAPPQPAVAGR